MIRGLTAVASSVIAMLFAPYLYADPAGDLARAESLFRSAKGIRDAGLYKDACPLFEESSRLEAGIGVLLYLGDCGDNVGRTASAWTGFR